MQKIFLVGSLFLFSWGILTHDHEERWLPCDDAADVANLLIRSSTAIQKATRNAGGELKINKIYRENESDMFAPWLRKEFKITGDVFGKSLYGMPNPVGYFTLFVVAESQMDILGRWQFVYSAIYEEIPIE